MRGPFLSGSGLLGGPLSGHVGQLSADLLDGRLSAEQERRVRLHLGRCPSCASAVHAAQDARRALRRAAVAPIGPSDDLMAGLLALSMPQGRSPMAASTSYLTAPLVNPGSEKPSGVSRGGAPSGRPGRVAVVAQVSRRPAHGLRGAVLVSTVLVSAVAAVTVGGQGDPSTVPSPAGLQAQGGAGVGPAVSGSSGGPLGSSALTGSALTGSALTGSPLTGSALGGSALAGSAVSGSALSGPVGGSVAVPAAGPPVAFAEVTQAP